MNKEAVRTIKGKTYAFRLDGSMRVNEYAGFSYTDYDGQPDPAGDILAVNADGTAKTVSEAEENEIAVYINAFPDGWRKKFRDDGWRFVYCPSGGHIEPSKIRGETYSIPAIILWMRRRKNSGFRKRMP